MLSAILSFLLKEKPPSFHIDKDNIQLKIDIKHLFTGPKTLFAYHQHSRIKRKHILKSVLAMFMDVMIIFERRE